MSRKLQFTLLLSILIKIAKSQNMWANGFLTSRNQAYAGDTISYDLTQLFIGGTVNFRGVVNGSDPSSKMPKFVLPFNQSLYKQSSILPEACDANGYSKAYYGDDYWILCGTGQVALYGFNYTTESAIMLTTTVVIVNGSVTNGTCNAIQASGNGANMFVLCKSPVAKGKEVFQLNWYTISSNSTNPYILNLNGTKIWTAATGHVVGDNYKLLVLGNNETPNIGVSVLVTNSFDNGGVSRGYKINVVSNITTPTWWDNTSVVNYPKGTGPNGGNISIIKLTTDSENLLFYTREDVQDSFDPNIYHRYYCIKFCYFDGPVFGVINCTLNYTAPLYVSEGPASSSLYPVTISAWKGTQAARTGDIILSTPGSTLVGTIGKGGFTKTLGTCAVQLLQTQASVYPAQSYFVNGKIYIWYQGFIAGTTNVTNFFRVVNPYTCTSIDITMKLPMPNPIIFIRKNFYRQGSVNMVAIGQNSIGTAPIRRPDVRFLVPANQSNPSDTVQANYQLAAAPVTQTAELYISAKVKVTWLNNFNGGIQFGNETIKSYGYIGAGNHVPTFTNTILGNGLRFITANDPNFDFNYAGTQNCSVDSQLNTSLAAGIMNIGGASQDIFYGSTGTGIMFAQCTPNIGQPGIVCANIINYNASTNGSTPIYIIQTGAVLRDKRIVVYLAMNNATSYTSTIQIFNSTGGTVGMYQAPGLLITSASIFLQEDNVVIYFTGRPDSQAASNTYSDNLYLLNFGIENVPAGGFRPLYVELLNAGQICAQNMVGYPYLSGGSYQFAIASACGGPSGSPATFTTVYHVRFNFGNPQLVYLQNVYFLNSVGSNAQICLTDKFIHAVDLNTQQFAMNIVSYDSSVSGGTKYVTPLNAYGIVKVISMACNPYKGIMHLVAKSTSGSAGLNATYIVNYNANNPQNPRKRIHSVMNVNSSLQSVASLFTYQSDKIFIIGNYIANGSQASTMACNNMWQSGPHLIMLQGSSNNTSGTKSFNATMTVFNAQNSSQMKVKSYTVDFMPPTLKGNISLLDTDKRVDLTLAANGTKVFDLNKWMAFVGPINAIKYVPKQVTNGNKNFLTQRVAPYTDNPYTSLNASYSGIKVLGNYTLVWTQTSVTYWQNSKYGVQPKGKLNGKVLSAELILSPNGTVFAFALMQNKTGQKFVGVWWQSASGNWQSATSNQIGNAVTMPQFFFTSTAQGGSMYFLGCVQNGARGQVIFHQIMLANSQVTVSLLNQATQNFNVPVTQFSATVINNNVVYAAFADTNQGTWVAAGSVDSIVGGISIYAGAYWPVIRYSLNKKNNYDGHVTDHYMAKLSCYGISSTSMFQKPSLFCAYATYGVYTYSVVVALNLKQAQANTAPLVDMTQSQWYAQYLNPVGYKPYSVSTNGLFVTLVSVLDYAYPDPNIANNSKLKSPWLITAYTGFQNTTNAAMVTSPFANWGPVDISNTNPYAYMYLSPQATFGPKGGAVMAINSNIATQTNVSSIKMWALNPRWKFVVQNYKQIYPNKDVFAVVDWTGSTTLIPLAGMFISSHGGPSSSSSTGGGGNSGNGGNGGGGNDAIYIIIIILIVLISSGVIGYVLYIKKRDEMKFKQEFDEDLNKNLQENDGDEEEGSNEGEDTTNADTLLTKSEFSRM